MRRVLPLLLLWSFCSVYANSLHGQVHVKATPPSFAILDNKMPVASIFLPAFDKKLLEAEDEADQKKGEAPRFGKKHMVHIGMETDGTWTSLPDGSRIWQMEIQAEEASSINLSYSHFWLPTGASFFVYAKDRSSVLGAFTEANNKGYGGFATGLIKSDHVVLEYYEPSKVKGKGKIQISEIIQGYVDLADLSRFYGDSGSCNEDISCSGNEDWASIAKSVALILVDGNRICSGTLISNTNQDCTPYFLTANHCLGDLDAEADNQAANWCFMFNYISPGCEGEDGPTDQTVCGAVVRANHHSSDFALLQLMEDPTEYDVIYAGWNREEIAAEQVTCIHHPKGDVKKISQDFDPVVSGNFGGPVADTHWKIEDWDQGTTEGGSSGAPLFNQNQELIGQLHGGSASCSGGESQGSDSYGKFSHSWNAHSSATRQLADWLDPQDTGAIQNPAWNCNSSAPEPIWTASHRVTCVGSSVDFGNLSTNNADEWLWHFEGGTPEYSSSENPSIIYDTPGIYDVTLTASNAYGSQTITQSNYITVSQTHMAPLLEYLEAPETILVPLNPDQDSCEWLRGQDDSCGNGIYKIDNYNVSYNNVGKEDMLELTVDLSQLQGTQFRFDVAYARYSAGFQDALEVKVGICGQSLTSVYYKQGADLATVEDSPAAFSPSSCEDWRTDEIDLSAYDGETVVISVINIGGWGNWLWLDNFEVFGNSTNNLSCQAAAYLEGAYEGAGNMPSENLFESLIPYHQPYVMPPWSYYGTENLSNFPIEQMDQIVDWVLVELRSSNDQEQIIAKQAALMMQDGSIRNKNGGANIEFGNHPNGSYYLVVRHRNHLDLISKSPVALPNDQIYDFRHSISSAQNGSLKSATDGKAMMIAGDFDGNGVINFLDYNRYLSEAAMILQYEGMDANLDGIGSVEDFNQYQQNYSRFAPAAVRY